VIAVRDISLVVIGMLLISLIPTTGGVSPETVSESAHANGLLLALDRLANYTQGAGCTSSEANALRERAWELYRAGKYNESIKEALKAMKLYHSAILLCQKGGEGSVEKTDWISIAKAEVAITANVLEYARKLIESGKLSEKELRELKAEYNQTLSAYNAVRLSLEENNTQDIAHKVAFLQTSRKKLEATVKLAVQNSVRVNAKLLGQAQLRKIDKLIARGANSTEVLVLRSELENAIKSGNSGEILRLPRKVPKVLEELERRGKPREIIHTTPGHPSFPGSSIEGSPSTPPKKTRGENPGNKK
jgi:hypothetical protein